MIIHGLSECFYVFGGVLKPLPGAVSLSLDPKITAAFDNRIRGGGKRIKYILEGYDGSIELAAVPFDFYRDILGVESDEDGTFTEITFDGKHYYKGKKLLDYMNNVVKEA